MMMLIYGGDGDGKDEEVDYDNDNGMYDDNEDEVVIFHEVIMCNFTSRHCDCCINSINL